MIFSLAILVNWVQAMRKLVPARVSSIKIKVLPSKKDSYWGKRFENVCKRVITKIDWGI